MRNRRRHRTHPVDQLRLAIDCLPVGTREAMLEGVRAEVAAGTRTWTAAQLADWIAARHGVRLSADRLRRHLRRAKISWQRTSRTLRHKQDPDEVAARAAVLTGLAKKGTPV